MNNKTLYVARRVKNWDDLVSLAEDLGLVDIIDKDDFHVTIAFSKEMVDWDQFVADTADIEINIEDGVIEKLGDAIVIKFESEELKQARQKYIDGGASWDYDEYIPHISLTYNSDQEITEDTFSGVVELWPEVMDEVDDEYLKKAHKPRVLCKSESHKTVTFVILEPWLEDRNWDIISADEIIKTAHEFVLNLDKKYVNVDHQEGTELEWVYFVESFVLPVDMSFADGDVVAWSRLVAFKFEDDTLYQQVLDGEFVWVSMEWYFVPSE